MSSVSSSILPEVRPAATRRFLLNAPNVGYEAAILEALSKVLATTDDIVQSGFFEMVIIAQIFVCVVTRSTTAEVQHNDMMMWTNVQNDLRHEMALEMWIVSVHEKSEQR